MLHQMIKYMGGTKDVGSALTRMCLRHRSVEARLKTFTSSMMDCLILPLQDRLEEWKKTNQILDKEHAKEFKRLSSTMKLQKKIKSGSINSVLSKSMESVDCHEKWSALEEMEKRAVRRALIEERSRFCLFVTYLSSVVEEELAMFHEFNHLKEVMDSLTQLTSDPFVLPSACELVISDMKITSNDGTSSLWPSVNLHNTPPSSPSSFGSRKSSLCSISSYNSSSSESPHHIHPHHPHHTSHSRYRSLSQPAVPSLRMLSISSQDSGFISQPDYSVPYNNHSAISITTASPLPPPPPPPPPPILAPEINRERDESSIHFTETSNCIQIKSDMITSNDKVSSLSSESTSSSPSVPLKDGQEAPPSTGPSFSSSQSSQAHLTRPRSISTSSHDHDRSSSTSRVPLNHTAFDTPVNHYERSSTAASRYSSSKSNNSPNKDGIRNRKSDENSIQSASNDNTNDCKSKDSRDSKSTLSSSITDGSSARYAHEYTNDKDFQKESQSNEEVKQARYSYSDRDSISSKGKNNFHTYGTIGDVSGAEDSNMACSEGSITPTNESRRDNSPINENSQDGTGVNTSLRRDSKQSPMHSKPRTSSESLYSSTTTLSRSGKPAPPPPVRRTSSISDPNAITLGTLKSAGVSTYEEIRALKRSIQMSNRNQNQYEELNPRNGQMNRRNMMSTSLTSLVEPIYSTLDQFSPSHSMHYSPNNPFITKSPTYDHSNAIKNGNGNHNTYHIYDDGQSPSLSRKSVVQIAHELDESLPPPPPEAYSDSENHSQSGHNRITNMRKEFLQTLNEKLSVPQNQRMSPKLVKRRSISLSNSDQEWDSDSASTSSHMQNKPYRHLTSTSSQHHTETLAQSLVRRLSGQGGGSSSSSSSSTFSFRRHSKTGSDCGSSNQQQQQQKRATSSTESQIRNEFDNSSNSSLSRALMNPSQQVSQVAKAAATEAIRRKKSLSECSSTSSTSEQSMSRSMGDPINQIDYKNDYSQLSQSYQSAYYSENERNSYYHKDANQPSSPISQSCTSTPKNHSRRSSQPSMGVTLSTNRQQQIYYNQPSSRDSKDSNFSTDDPYSTTDLITNIGNSSQNKTLETRESVSRHNLISNENSAGSIGESIYAEKIHEIENKQNKALRPSNSNPLSFETHHPTKNQSSGGNIGAIENAIAARVQNWLASRASTREMTDLISCRETLMDQIRKGKQLRKVAPPDEKFRS
ncbi:uncharacterized protein LOC141849300 isoform X2 [Brevipalpus obovatus]|uniref:uncharacterized protein LOC141849300 isoform X2 n=1 Tax=Brevipalpus obovatus TaxID=246614 RepID=UPI003D9DB611